jgi:hypothetical protein
MAAVVPDSVQEWGRAPVLVRAQAEMVQVLMRLMPG